MQFVNLVLLAVASLVTVSEAGINNCFGCGILFTCNPFSCPPVRRRTYSIAIRATINVFAAETRHGVGRYISAAARLTEGGDMTIIVSSNDNLPNSVTNIAVQARIEAGHEYRTSFDPLTQAVDTITIPAAEVNTALLNARRGDPDPAVHTFAIYIDYQLNQDL